VPNFTSAKFVVAYKSVSEFDENGVGTIEFYKIRFVLASEYTWVSPLKGIHCNGNVFCLLLVWK